MTGRGGWPLSVFLTPDLQPFYGGTYFPPENRHNIPGFRNVLLTLNETWNQTLAEMFGMGSYPLETVIESEISENKTALISSFPDLNLTEGAIFDYGAVAFESKGVLNASITNISDDNVTYKLIPENGSSVELPFFNWTIIFIVENDTAFTMRSIIEEGHIFSIESYYGSLHFKVIAVNETHAKLAMNTDAPELKFIGETLIFELEVVKVYKTSVLLES